MTKTILIPTDFSIESLNILKSFLHHSEEGSKFNIILLHGAYLGDSITDLLYFSKRNNIENFSNPLFDEALNIIKNKYSSSIGRIIKEIFTGRRQSAFNNFIEANNIDEAIVPSHHSMNLSNKNSFDIIPYILKSNIKINEIVTSPNQVIPEKGELAEVFFNRFTTQ